MTRQKLIILICSFVTAFGTVQSFGQSDSSPFTMRGYVKEMPAIQLNKDFADPVFMNILHNRLNFRWNITAGTHFALEGRNRLFYNEVFIDFPEYKKILDHDPGLIDLSWVWLSDGAWIGHSMIDRLYVDWRKHNWHLRVGRQRINWGVNLVSNPNDLFNTYSFFDFDYEERPGADAIRLQYHLGFASRIEAAYSPAKNAKESTAAILWLINHKGYDLQAIAGYYQHRAALGFGWAGNVRMAGFKGEFTWFYDLEKIPETDRANIVAAVGVDYMFGSGTFAVLEFLYNGGYARTGPETFLVNQPLRPDNIMFSEFATTLSLQHPFGSLLSGGLALMALPDIPAGFIMPSLNYSLMTNLDMNFVGQLFVGEKGSIFEQAGSSWFLALQYSF